jgi:hypothetical protein
MKMIYNTLGRSDKIGLSLIREISHLTVFSAYETSVISQSL